MVVWADFHAHRSGTGLVPILPVSNQGFLKVLSLVEASVKYFLFPLPALKCNLERVGTYTKHRN